MTEELTVEDVAAWMLDELRRDGMLSQDVAAGEIDDRFGEQFIYCNANGNLAIRREVLQEFRRLSGDHVVWCRSDRYWRPREEWDLPSREQP